MRRSRYLKHKSKNTKFKPYKLVVVSIFIFLIVIFCFISYKVSSLEKFSYVNNKDGNAEIIVVDPQKDKIVKILIDKDFQLESSRSLGEYRLSSLWVLGQKEKYKGKLVSESIVKNFGIPIYLWKDGDLTNLNLYQRVKVLLLNTRNYNDDYLLNSKTPKDSILINFVHPYVALNLTGKKGVTETVSKILETVGFKTVDYSRGYDDKLDCEVVGKNKKYNDIVSKIFDCTNILDLNLYIDLKIRIGKSFSDRF